MALFLKRYKNGGNGGGAEPFGRTMHRNAGGTGDTEEKLLTHFGNFTTTFENIQALRGKKSKSGLEI